ncbi:MAG: sulfatase-like hydrolase/transferase [Luteolibacter sp.]
MKFRYIPLIATCLLAGVASAQSEKRPNILFIAIDDLRPTLGAYGNPDVISPHMDKLAAEGRLFDRAYCQYAICGPSRASIMTGLRPSTLKIEEISTYFRNTVPDAVTLPQHFKQNGYRTEYIGKIFHPGQDDEENSWDRRIPLPGKGAYNAGAYILPESNEIVNRRREEAVAEFGKAAQLEGMGGGPAWEAADAPDNEYLDGRVADGAIKTLSEMKGDKPFFLGVGFHKPHLPFVAPKKYFDLYDPAKLKMTDTPNPPKDGPTIGIHSSFELRTRTLVPTDGPIDELTSRELLRAYYACTSFIDAQIGRIIDELETQGLRDNTIIVVWGDHGWHLGEYGIWGKATNYEVSARVPLIVWTPEMAKGGIKSDALVEFVDVYPTLCELAGLPVPKSLEGKSFAPQLADPEAPGKPAAYSQFPSPALREWAARPLSEAMRKTFFGPIITRVEAKLKEEHGERYDAELFSNHVMGYSMRTDKYRLTAWLDNRDISAEPLAIELYDHTTDPNETTNIASQQPEIVEQLMKQLFASPEGVLPAVAFESSLDHPYSDQKNSGEWVLNKTVSDEFNAPELDEEKWLIQGKNGEFKSNWIGRAPSQFSVDNVRVEDGKLILQSRWEPDFKFSNRIDKTFLGKDGKGLAHENITTAAVICKNNFKHGYMEIRCKAANASVTSSFWGTGAGSELDVFEIVGAPTRKNAGKLDQQFQTNIIDWGKGVTGERRRWRGKHILDWRPADDFHIYGCEWNEDGIKLFAGGKEIQSVTREELGAGWVLTNPIWIWVDSETFPWVGLPTEESLPADFEIDYIRVWQKAPKP